MIKKIFIIVFSLWMPHSLLSQDKPNYENIAMQIILHYPDSYIKSVVDTDDLLQWTGLSKDTIEAAIHSYKTDHTINIIVILRSDQKPEYRINIYPANKDISEGLLNNLNRLPDFRIRSAVYAHQFIIELNKGGCDELHSCLGDIQLPVDEEKHFLENATIAQSYQHIKDWAAQNMKVFSVNEVTVSNQFAGVQAVGTIMEKDISVIDVYQSTAGNDLYWRAIMEMEKGNEIIPMSMVMMYLAKGDIDRAGSWLRLLSVFYKQKGSLARYMFEEASWRVDMFNNSCTAQVQKGIALHDKGKYAAAIEIYKGLLNDYPNSAWAWHELYLSTTAQNLKDPNADVDKGLWTQYADSIYSANPMYPYAAHAKNGREGYALYRRGELLQLFKKKESLKQDLLTYAEISIDLGNYDYAAETYWYLLSNVEASELGKKSFLPYYLYCMNKLGHKSVIHFFKDDYTKDFEKIDKEIEKRMTGNVMYNSFKEKE